MKLFSRKCIFLLLTIAMIANKSFAADPFIPDAARHGAEDAERFSVDHNKEQILSPPEALPKVPAIAPLGVKVPNEAKNIHFVLKDITLEGATAFTPEELKKLYQKYINTDISLDVVWQIAAAITKHYQDHGYFLSQAFVPQQEIGTNGKFTIKVVEGYVGAVELDNNVKKNYIIGMLIERLKSEKPANIRTLESILLQLNDLPGMSFRSVIEPLKDQDGEVKIILVGEKKKGSGQVSFDNYNSMYLGPYEGSISYDTSIIPLNETSITILKSLPIKKLKYYSASDEFTILPGVSLGIYGGHTIARPGYTLKNYVIESDSENFGFSLTNKIIRQRQQNLTLKFKIEGKNVSSDILSNVLTRDHIRTAVVNVSYDSSDYFKGYDYSSVTFTQGLNSFGASQEGDANLSRQNVSPDFKKIELSLSRFQGIGQSWMTVTSTAMQFSSGPLYSSDQFGYGGQAFGRAFDSSEISDDNGMNGSIELRYTALPVWNKMSFVPFAFYDIGKVWGSSDTSKTRNSIGEGIRLETENNFSASFTIANPLMHGEATPRFDNTKSPRYLAQISYRF